MRQSALKVREMISDGAISEAEGKELLSALDEKKSITVDWLWNPFPRVQVTTALGLGLVVSALSIGLAVFSDVKFRRLFGVTVRPVDVSWFVAVRDQLMAWPFVALVFWGIAKLAQSRVRLRDLVAYLGLARLPVLLEGLLSIFLEDHRSESKRAFNHYSKAIRDQYRDPDQLVVLGSDTVYFVAVNLITSLPLWCWAIVLLVNAFRTATGLRGWRLTAALVLGSAIAMFSPLLVLGLVI